ncbi:hypothetical protein DRO02_04260 [archaeon]|nr:MAG: hypothetical protein DRO21_05205 [archaeon]RLG64487.1 MAG: hypothetical protein DRO02_04260 [archaeon]HDM23498.1 hypothetical protein [Candidatus Bathyarchaeota archaeon]
MEMDDSSSIENFQYYPYAGFDFLISRDGQLYFLEANGVAAGIAYVSFVARQLGRYVVDKRLLKMLMPNMKLLDRFVQMSITYYRFKTGSEDDKPLVAITYPKHGSKFIEWEIRSIRNAFKNHGIEAYIVNKKNARMGKDGYLRIRINGYTLIPDLIIRRTLNFPDRTRQPMINPREVGEITKDKWITYKVVRDFLKKHPEYEGTFKLPETHFISSSNKLISRVYDMLDAHGSVVVKPVDGCGGKGITFIRSRKSVEDRLEPMVERTEKRKSSIIVQEEVNVMPFQGFDGHMYAFDLRIYGLLGRFAGGHVRRSPLPRGSPDKDLEKKCVSNISSGGAFALLLLGGEKDLTMVPLTRIAYRFGGEKLPIEGNALILGGKLLENLRKAVTCIAWAISEAVMKRKGM